MAVLCHSAVRYFPASKLEEQIKGIIKIESCLFLSLCLSFPYCLRRSENSRFLLRLISECPLVVLLTLGDNTSPSSWIFYARCQPLKLYLSKEAAHNFDSHADDYDDIDCTSVKK